MESHCLYHVDRDEFSLLQKDLQRSGWIPRKYVHRLAMAVCSCRKNKATLADDDTIIRQKDVLKNIFEEQQNTLPKRLLSTLDTYLNTNTTSDYSLGQLMTILVFGSSKDFSLLSRAVLSPNSKFSEKDKLREKNRNKKITPAQVEMIKKKKKRKMNSCVLKLPMFPGNYQKMKIEFVKENGFVDPDYKLNNSNFDAKKNETYVKVWGNPKNITSLKQRLLQEAKRVQAQMDAVHRARREQRLNRLTLDWLDSEEFEPVHFKDHLTDDFSLKAHKSAKNKSKAAVVKAQASVLDGGHCLQCFKPFTDLHDKTSCTFHKRYPVYEDLSNKRVWLCCSLEVKEDLDPYTAHGTTGCSTSVVHNWRTHSKAKGKDREKQEYKNLH